jgi:RNA polymerase sigma-70 factor (ECF subfamily)
VSDAALAERACAGDGEAFAELVERHAARVHRWLCATGLAPSDADDVVQEAFVRVHRHLARYDRRRSFSTWLFAIAHRVRLDCVTRRRQHAPLEAATVAAQDEAAPSFPPGSLWSRLRALLPERSFQALWLHYGEGLDAAGVAQVLGITGLHARVLLHRARSRCAPALAAEGWAIHLGGAS